MIYAYKCSGCSREFDVVKPAAHYNSPEQCICGTFATRQFAPSIVYFSNTKVQEAEYNPGLGCIVKDRQHRKELCKIRGLEEIGSEPVESVHKHYDTAREDKRNKSYDDADKGWIGDGT